MRTWLKIKCGGCNDGGGESGAVAKDGSEVPEVGKAAEPVSAGAVLENSIGSVRVGMAGSGRDPEAIADGGGDSGVRVFVPSAGRGLPARPVENTAAEDQAEAKEVLFPQKYRLGTSSTIGAGPRNTEQTGSRPGVAEQLRDALESHPGRQGTRERGCGTGPSPLETGHRAGTAAAVQPCTPSAGKSTRAL